jgi:GWxTD domain-containing protein
LTFLVRHLAESTLVAMVLVIAAATLRRLHISAAARHALWLFAFAKFILPAALLWSAGASLAVFWTSRPVLQSRFADFSRLLNNAGTGTAFTTQESAKAWIVPLVAGVWAAGTIFFIGYWTYRLRRCTFRVAAPPEPVQAALGRAQKELGIRGYVALAISKDAREPVVRGVWRPVLIMPESLLRTLSLKELHVILLHELAHVRRGDNLTSSLAHLICSVFWFHPLLWWMERHLSIDCEYACDEIVLATTRTSADYISAIVKATRIALFGAVAGISAIGGFEFRKRLEWIMSQNERLDAGRKPRSIVITAATALILLPIWGGFASRSVLQAQSVQKRHGIEFLSASASGTAESQQILASLKALLNPNDTIYPSTGNDRWDKWLNEEVVYLITTQERAAFIALQSDREREEFVNQFWEKRNPNPGLAVNAFKSEHYRRLAYANDHFAVHDAAGWQTDRGRTYVLMGPPDEIDSHPSQYREMWRYRIGITIEFDTSDVYQH